jgi:hypothetical protein
MSATLFSLKRNLRKMLLPPQLLQEQEAARLAQGEILTRLARSQTSTRIADYEFKVFSQWGEDGIIQWLIREVPIAEPTFIEFGVEDFAESNCRFLLQHDNWRGFVLDGNRKKLDRMRDASWFWKHELRSRCAHITRENLDALLRESGFGADLGVLSIDVDGVDYWLLDALTAYTPRLLIVEYNALFGDERAITVPYDPAFSRREKHFSDLYFGASLGALTQVADRKGYDLVGVCSAGVNAFFVRRDVRPTSVPRQSVREAYMPCLARQSRNEQGKLSYLDRDAQLALVRGLPVVNVETGREEVW